MIIGIGSKNPTKIAAVEEYFSEAEVKSFEVDSEVSEQPSSLEETIEGARVRAFYSRATGIDFSVGIESGIMLVPVIPGFKSDWMNIVICCICHKEHDYIGMSSGFVVPKIVTDIAFRDKVDLSEAVLRAELTKEKKIGYKEGIIHLLTDGKMDRKEYIKQAIMMTMIQMKHPKLY